MHPRCETCGLNFDHEEGYWTGAMAFNIVFAEVFFVVILVAVVVSSWPNIPMMPLIVAGLVTNLIFPIFFYPMSKTLWLAFDLSFFHAQRPYTREEVEAYAAARAALAVDMPGAAATTVPASASPPTP